VLAPVYILAVGCIIAVYFRETDGLHLGLYILAAFLPVVYVWYALIGRRFGRDG